MITPAQALTARLALRAALASDFETWSVAEFIMFAGAEIELLREEGVSDGAICDIIARACGIRIDSVDLANHHAIHSDQPPNVQSA